MTLNFYDVTVYRCYVTGVKEMVGEYVQLMQYRTRLISLSIRACSATSIHAIRAKNQYGEYKGCD